MWEDLELKPQRMAMPNFPESTSFALTKDYHVNSKKIVERISKMLKINIKTGNYFKKDHPHDVPGDWFTGPF